MNKTTELIINNLATKKELEIDEARWYDTDNGTIELTDAQLDAIYEKAVEEDMYFEAECYMSHHDVEDFKDEFIENRTEMYLEENDEDEADGLAIEDADNIKDEADTYVEYLLDDKGSNYDTKFTIKEVSDDGDITFVVKDKVVNALNKQHFSENNEPVIHDDELVNTVKLFK